MSQTNLETISVKPNDSTEEMSERKIRMYIIKTIREENEEMREQMQALKEEMKEQMQALNDHTNQQLKEQIREARIISIKRDTEKNSNKQKSLK